MTATCGATASVHKGGPYTILVFPLYCSGIVARCRYDHKLHQPRLPSVVNRIAALVRASWGTRPLEYQIPLSQAFVHVEVTGAAKGSL